MRRHTLTDAAFAALAAGRPDAAAVDELRRAQLGRHLLMLRAIVEAAPEQARQGYAALAAAEPAAVREVASDPLVGLWAASCLAALTRGEAPEEAGVERLAQLAAAAGAHGLAEQGCQPPDGAHGLAEQGCQRPGGAHGLAAQGGRRRLRATRDGLTIDVRLEDTDPVRARFGLTPAGRLTDRDVACWQEHLTEAWALLVDRHREAAVVLASVLRVIVPVRPDPGVRGISATSADAYGAVAISAPATGTELAVGLLHEAQHSVLNAVRYLFELHTGPDALGYSPWRDDPRPPSGVLHGAYAYLAVTRFWRTEARAGGGPVAAFEFARWRAAVASAADELLASDGLTAAGRRFVGALRDEVRPWLDEPVPPHAERLATTANTEHRARWRLRNLAVDPDAVRTLADAWRDGRPRPAADIPTRLVPAPGRALESSDRVRLAHELLAGGAGGPEPVPGSDTPLVPGSHGTARDAYLKRDDAAWTGLAQISAQRALRETPEIVAAVYRALGDPRVDPERLAAWLSRSWASVTSQRPRNRATQAP